MKLSVSLIAGASLLTTALVAPGAELEFQPQTIDDTIEIGYGLAIGDVDGDGKSDILLADKKDFVWYRNPGGPGEQGKPDAQGAERPAWTRHVMLTNLTLQDNVCIAARDLDGDGKVEVAVGANWNPGETSDEKQSGSVHILVRPSDPTQLWTPVALPHEPTVHRMQWVDWGADDSRHSLVVVPLHGRDNKKGAGDNGVRQVAYDMPGDSSLWGDASAWQLRLLDDSLHVSHNFDVLGDEIVIGGAEGVVRRPVNPKAPVRNGLEISPANSSPPIQGVGEIRVSSDGRIATVEPFHGNMVAVYEKAGGPGSETWKREQLDDTLAQGHALAWADVMGLGEGKEQVIAGWREPDASGKVGIKLFYREGNGKKWKSALIDDNTMACEDLKVADLDGDGDLDIIAAGRATLNLIVYWNQATK